MNPNRVLAIMLRQYYLLRRSPARVFNLFIWVAVDIISWGFITKFLNGITNSAYDFVPLLLGALLLWNFLVRVMQGVTLAFFEDIWSRNFLNIFASPLKISEYVAGLLLSSIATSSVGLAVMLVLATAIFGLSVFAYGIMLVPFLLILFLFGIALGILGSGIVLRLGPASEWFIWPIPALLAPFAGVFYPISTLPHWMQYISHLLPPAYVFEAMRAILAGKEFSVSLLFLSLALATFYILLAFWFFNRVYKQAVKTGLIARYSAESLS